MSDIAINPVTRRVQFTGNTGTGPFAFTFNVLNSSDIAVYKNTTLLTLTADYTVTIAANGTGSVTLQAGQAVVAADYVTIIGGRDLERTTDFVTAGDLLASSLNEQLDSNVIMSQQLDESFGRSISSSPGDVDVSMTLPTASSRANQVLAFTSTGAVTTTNLNDLPELTVDKLNVDNLTLDGNTISTTNSNGNLILTPNGTGDVVVSGDLVVNGTTTTIHSTVVDIADKNITIAYGSSDAAAANGAGITVDGADATMNYYSTPDGWEFNKAVTVGYTGSTPQDLGGVLNVYSSSSSVPGMVIKSSSTSVDPKIQFEYSSQIWTVGQDSSSDDFKIINGTNLNSSAEIHINTDGDVALGGVSHYSNYELSVPQRVAIRSGSAVAAIDFAGTTELVFDGNVGNTNSGFSKFRFASWEADKMVIDGNTLKVNALAKLSGSEVSISDNLKFGDNNKAIFGAGSDLQIYHNGTDSLIADTGSGTLKIYGDTEVAIQDPANGEYMAKFIRDGAVELYHNNALKIATSATGISVTGSITADSFGGVLSIPDGSSSAPSLTNTGNTNTGLYFPANNQVGISASASEIVNISTLGVKITPFSGTDALVLNNNDTSIGDNNAIARIIATADDPTADQEGAEILFLSAGAWSTDSYPTEIILRTDNGGSLTNRMVVGSTGIDVTGTVTADGLTVDGTPVRFNSTAPMLYFMETGVTDSNHRIRQNAGNLYFQKLSDDEATATTRMVIDGSGDINFYEDTGTTAKFFWDASVEGLGIGNTSFTNKLNVTGAMPSSGTPLVQLSENSGSARDGLYLDYTGTTNSAVYSLKIADATKTHLAVRGDGNVGIGTASPTALIDISKSGTADYSTLRLSNTGASGRKYEIGLGGNAAASDYANKLYFRDSTANANRITLDSSGNVGIGTSSPHDFGVNCRVLTLNGVKGGSLALTRGTNSATKQWAIRTSDDDALRFEYGPTLASEAMRIDSSGRLLLNTTTEGNSAADDFTVSGSGNIGITIRSTTSNDSAIYFSDGISGASEYQGYIAYAHADNTFRFGVTGVECMRLDASGNLLVRKDGTTVGSIKSRNSESLMIGSDFGTDAYICLSNDNVFPVTSTGAVKDGATDLGVSTGRFKDLYLSGDVISDQAFIGGPTDIGYKFHLLGDAAFERTGTTSQTMVVFRNGNGNVGSISTSGSATAYNTSSDYRLKTDAQPMTGATDRIKQLNPVNFEWIADGTRVDGFLAHEAQAVVPEAVTGTKDAMRDEEYEVTPAITDDDGNVVTEAVMGTRSVPDYQGIDQSKMVPLLVATIHELEARITALENA